DEIAVRCAGRVESDSDAQKKDDAFRRLLLVLSDISAQIRAEETAREWEQFLSYIVENIPYMIAIKEAENLSFVHFNKAGESILGYSREELIGKNDYDFFSAQQAGFFRSKDREALNKGRLVTIMEEPIDTKHGQRLLQTKKIPVMNRDGKPAYLVGIAEDITERKQDEKKLRESEERTQHLNSVLQTQNIIDRIIYQAQDLKQMLDEVCQALVSSRGYKSSCIVLLDEKEAVRQCCQAGLAEQFPELLARFETGRLPSIAKKALSSHLLQVVVDPVRECPDCVLAQSGVEGACFSVRLEFEGIVHGLLTVSIPRTLARDMEEQELLSRMAGTLSQGIHRLHLETIRRTQEERLKNYQRIVSRISMPMSIVTSDYRYLIVNDAYQTKFGKSKEEIEGYALEDLLGTEIFHSKIKPHLDNALSGDEVTFEDSFPDLQGNL
ncbi:PAS domain-containing protein, partial [Desulfonatronospira sp. MSAO_Bac3]|uniref:PAS domain-containing protein n=1 Tax=Desulfonatronospira sp. MSAO_Bac3 TaxID=2293857 RepID=UPI000FF099B8